MKVETGGRGALHAHHLVAQPGLQPGRLQRLLDAVGPRAVFNLVERLMCGMLPGAWRVGTHRGRPVAEHPSGVPVPPLPPHASPAMCMPPYHAMSADAADAALARATVHLQMHVHTARCRKGGHAGDDSDCAMRGVRVPHAATSFDDGVLLARLDHPALVFHIPTITRALNCNNAGFLFAEQSRFNLELQRHREAVERGDAKAADEPRPATLAEASADAMFYTAKYVGKSDFEPRSTAALTMTADAVQVRSVVLG
jgi:hypothetical protein